MRQTLFLLLLLPQLIYASFGTKDYRKESAKISAEWQRHEELVAQFNRLGTSDKRLNTHLLQESIACCERAMSYCEHVLKKIAKKPKDERKDWVPAKQECEARKHKFRQEIEALRGLMARTFDLAKAEIRERLLILREEAALFGGLGMQLECYEIQKQMVPLLEQLGEEAGAELAELKKVLCL